MMDRNAKRDAFMVAIERLGIKSTDAKLFFNVTRQTFTSWVSGRSKVPDAAILAIVQLDNREYLRRKSIKDAARQLGADDEQ